MFPKENVLQFPAIPQDTASCSLSLPLWNDTGVLQHAFSLTIYIEASISLLNFSNAFFSIRLTYSAVPIGLSFQP